MNDRTFPSFFEAILIQKILKTLRSLFVVLLVRSFLTPEFSQLKSFESNTDQQIQHLAKRDVSCFFLNVSREVLYTMTLVEKKENERIIHFYTLFSSFFSGEDFFSFSYHTSALRSH